MRFLVFVLAFGVVVAGCGGSSTSAATQLTIDAHTGDATVLVPTSATLTCDGTPSATGFLRATAKQACTAVASGAVQTVAKHQRSRRVCSQIYGGPQHARITGTVDDKNVDVTVTRTDGCGVDDWQQLIALLGEPERTGDAKSAGASSPATSSTTPAPQTYTVQRGDTMSSIAAKFSVLLADLLGANQLADPDNLVEGQTITIPVVTQAVLTVAPDPGTSSTGLKFSLTGARPGELVTFSVITYGSTFTGQPHEADSSGSVTATYDPGSTAGTFLITATGTRGTTARATFVVESGKGAGA